MGTTESKRNQTTSTKGAKTPDAAKSTPATQTGPVTTAVTEDVVEAVVGKKSEISEGE